MALGAECRVQLTRRGLQVQHMVGVGATLCPPPNCTHLRRDGQLLLQLRPLLSPPLLPPLPRGALAVLRAASAAFSCSRSSLLSASRRRIYPPMPPLPSRAACAACAASWGVVVG